MGTHPIFESDFDCLTDKKWTRCGRVYAISKRRSKKKLTIRMRIVDQHACDHFKKILTLINAVQVIFRKFHLVLRLNLGSYIEEYLMPVVEEALIEMVKAAE